MKELKACGVTDVVPSFLAKRQGVFGQKTRDSDSKMEVVFAREEDVHPHILEHNIYIILYNTMGVLLLM